MMMSQRASSVESPVHHAEQMRVFYWCLGFALLGHQFNWISMNIVATRQSIFSYIDSYGELVPVLDLGPWLTGIGHLFFFIAAAFLIVSSRRNVQRLVALLCLPFLLLAFFVQGYKPANHYFLLMVIVSVHATYWVLSRRTHATAADEAHQFMRRTLLYVIVLTYVLAGVSKLNADFFSPTNSIASLFVWKPISPFNRLAKMAMGEGVAEPLMYAYGLVGIGSTLLFELLVPFGLLFRRWRTTALAALMLFHLLILSFSAIDFSLVCMCTYPLIARSAELKEFMSRYVRRPTTSSLIAAALYTAHCTVINVHDKIELLRGSYFAYMEIVFRAGVTFGVAYLILRSIAMLWMPIRERQQNRAPAIDAYSAA